MQAQLADFGTSVAAMSDQLRVEATQAQRFWSLMEFQFSRRPSTMWQAGDGEDEGVSETGKREQPLGYRLEGHLSAGRKDRPIGFGSVGANQFPVMAKEQILVAMTHLQGG